jgi:hypothetical protein
MANKFKYNKTGAEANSIFKGNWAIDTTLVNTGGGPSSVTSFYHGASVPAGGYSVYNNGTVFTATNDTQLLGKVAQLGGDTGSVNAALQWLKSQANCVVLNKDFPNIVTDNLSLHLDPSNISSFVDSQPILNLLYSAGAYNLISGAGDIYGNCTKTDLGGGKFRFVNNGNGGSTIRVYTNQADLIAGATYACSVYFENLYGSLSIDWCDVGITGTNSSTSPSGRLGGYSSRATYDGPYYFLDINLSTRGEVTLFNPQVEKGSSVTAFVNGTRTQGTVWTDTSKSGLTFNSYGSQTPFTTLGGASAFQFNGDGYWACTSGFDKVDLAGDCTIIMWIYNNVAPHDSRRTIFQKNGTVYAPYEQEIAVTWEAGTELSWYSRYGSYDYASTPAVDIGWTMMGIKMSTGKGSPCRTGFYSKNGGAWTNNYFCRSNNPIVPADAIVIGTGYSGAVVQGAIGMVMCYNKMLSDEEILQNFNATKSTYGL